MTRYERLNYIKHRLSQINPRQLPVWYQDMEWLIMWVEHNWVQEVKQGEVIQNLENSISVLQAENDHYRKMLMHDESRHRSVGQVREMMEK